MDDESLAAQYIRAIENSDSIGYKNGFWFAPTLPEYDKNNRGMGVDVVYNEAAAKVVRGREGKWLSEDEERSLRNAAIERNQKILDSHTPKILREEPSEAKKAMATGMLYRGDSVLQNPKIRNAYYSGSDKEMQKAVADYYNKKGLTKRAEMHNRFFTTKQKQKAPIGILKPKPSIPYKFQNPRYIPPKLFSEGGNMRDNNWDKLSYQDKADIMKVAVANGYTSLSDIRKEYNKFADGGNTNSQSPSNNSNSEDSKYYAYMEKLAAKKAKDWKQNPDDTLLQMLNDNEYNYRAFWDYDRDNAENMLTEDPDAHFSDIGKTVYHPTFSNESKYSGRMSDYNPRGTIGGMWENEGRSYAPSESQFVNGDIDLIKTRRYLNEADPNVNIDLRNAPGTLPHIDNNYAEGGNLFKGGGVAHDAKYNHVTSLYQAYVDAGLSPQVALELTNQKIAEKGWTGWASGDNKKFSNVKDFVNHTIDYHNRMYPDTLKAKDFNGFFNGLENGKYRYNPYPAVYRNLLQQTRGGVKKRVNDLRATQGLEPLALMNTPYSPPAIDGNYLVPQPEILGTEEPLLNLAAYGGNLFSKGGRKNIAIQANVPKAVNYLMSKGISRIGAAAIVGTLQAESGMNPAIHAMMKGDTGEGLAQWTGSRKKIFWKTLEKIEPGAQKRYKNVVNVPLERQLDVVLAERPEVTKAISNAKDVHTATDIMLRAYENGGGTVKNMASRNQMDKIYGKWNNGYNTLMRKRVGNASKVLGIKFDPSMYASNNKQGQISDDFFTAFNNSIANTAAQARGNEIMMQDPALSYKPTTIIMPPSEANTEPKLSITYDPNEEKTNNLQKFNTIMGILGGGSPFSAMAGGVSSNSGIGMLPFIDSIYGK